MSLQQNPASSFLPITSLQTKHYQAITHSFAQRQSAIPSNFSRFRTLSIATGVGGYTVRNVLARNRNPDQRRSSAAHVNHEDQLDAAPTNCATQQHPPQWTRL